MLKNLSCLRSCVKAKRVLKAVKNFVEQLVDLPCRDKHSP